MKNNIIDMFKSQFNKQSLNAGVTGTELSKVRQNLNLENKKKSKKEEPKEASATGGGYGYTGPAFSLFAKDDVARSEYKKPKVKEVREEKNCGGCDKVESECICDKTKKIEATEATSSSSTGPYDANSFQDIKMKGNTPKGKGRSWKKTQIPGGSFVQVKSKCKKFPYCNQGDISSLKLFENETLKKVIEKVSKKYDLPTQLIKEIISQNIKKRINP